MARTAMAEQSAAYLEAVPQMVDAQESAQVLSCMDVLPVKKRLAVRPKLKDEVPADNCFVNVVVEAKSSRTSDNPIVDRLIAALGQGPYPVVQRGNLLSVTVPISELDPLSSREGVESVSPSEPLKLDIPAGTVTSRAPATRKIAGTATHHHGEHVMIGIIDVGGFDFAHPDFLDANKQTRFVAIWDQGARHRPPPARFGYGAELTEVHLRAAMTNTGGFAPGDLEPQSQRSIGSHGTHVASIAAGNLGVCPRADIAAVLIDVPQARTELEQRRLSFADTSRIVHAVEYLVDLAKERSQPISINISLGTNGGPHDGSGATSRWLETILASPGRAICVAAGNSGQEGPTSDDDVGWITGRIHTSGCVAARGLEVEFEWVVVGNGLVDVSENELEIWFSPQDLIVASVQPPGSDRWYEVKPKEYRQNQRLPDGTTLSIYSELYHPANGANYIAVYQSPNLDPANPRGVTAGVWRIRLRGEEIRDGRFHAWIERDDPVEIGRREGQRILRFPSFFSERSNVDSHSVSSLAAGHSLIAVGCLDAVADKVNIISSQGPTRDGRFKPDVVADGTNVTAARGFAPDGEGDWVSMTGTSMASPYVAGVIGLMLAVNPKLTSAQCAGILQATSRPLPGAPYEWQNDAGFGRLDPVAAITEARTFSTATERK